MNKKHYKLYSNCKYFPLDRPCVYQKNNNALCPNCTHYTPVNKTSNVIKILIIKLGAMGDVLRTTFILEGLKEKYKNVSIDWLVEEKNKDTLVGNKFINNIIINDSKVFSFLTSNKYNIVINLDLAPESLAFATLAMADKKIGYWLDENRKIKESNNYAKKWLLTSAYDTLKKENEHTYQYWMAKIAELPKDNYEIIVPVSKQAKQKAKNLNIPKNNKKIIGINPSSSKRWKMKKWNLDKFIKLTKILSDKGYTILLLGGKEDEFEINKILSKKIKNVYSTGLNNSVQEFFAIINLCDIIICGDTMAMHAALGLKKNVVAIFGPTSSNEIEMYNRGIKVIPKTCSCCYRQECSKKITCMDEISVDEVLTAIKNLRSNF